jgi:pyrroline-5-carboxylate reductase
MTSSTSKNSLHDIGSLALIGAGKMGGAMLDGWLALGLSPQQVTVIDPNPSPEIRAQAGFAINPAQETMRPVRVVVIAVKPQVSADVLPQIAPLIGKDTVAVSIMAGKTLDFLQRHVPANAALVRAMPNTPAAIGRGITVAVANPQVTTAQRELVQALLAATGDVEWVADEALMDAVTALSGSGPAYVFHLAEALAAAGKAAGLPADLAMRLARATVSGAGELLHRASETPAQLRQNVTSPGGTTAAALEVLMADDGLSALMTEAVKAAAKRSRELAD